MGYKLAGFNVLGGVEIDPEMMAIYRSNHNPKHSFLMSITKFNKLPREEIPNELFNLDILDGSPPCSSFSMAGSREKAWGEKKKFREGQTEQILDDLFFHFIETARILQPKIVVAENVKGLVIGKAKGYVKQIFNMFNLAGYETQLFLLNAAFMGVPQRRERTFFIAKRRDLKLPKVEMKFNEKIIPFGQVYISGESKPLSESFIKWWKPTKPGKSLSSSHPKGSYFNAIKLDPKLPAPTQISSSGAKQCHWDLPIEIAGKNCSRIQSFPDDYNFGAQDPKYVCGMSVPPYMMQRVANQIQIQLLDKLEKNNG